MGHNNRITLYLQLTVELYYIYISYAFQRYKLHPMTVEYETCQENISCFTQHCDFQVNNNNYYNKRQQQYNKYKSPQQDNV